MVADRFNENGLVWLYWGFCLEVIASIKEPQNYFFLTLSC